MLVNFFMLTGCLPFSFGKASVHFISPFIDWAVCLFFVSILKFFPCSRYESAVRGRTIKDFPILQKVCSLTVSLAVRQLCSFLKAQLPGCCPYFPSDQSLSHKVLSYVWILNGFPWTIWEFPVSNWSLWSIWSWILCEVKHRDLVSFSARGHLIGFSSAFLRCLGFSCFLCFCIRIYTSEIILLLFFYF